MDSFLENLKQDVQCSLCHDTLTEPKILKCYHTFCKPCIKRHAELIEEVNVFKCPECKSETRLPDLNSVDDLEPSALHSRMVKVVEFVESEKVCSVSGCHPPASWHCFDCNRSLCDQCEKGHSMFTKDHKVIFLFELKAEDLKEMLTGDTNCEDHVDKIVELFCKDCEEIICLECLKNDHEGHLTVTLSAHAKRKRALLSDRLEKFRLHQITMETKFKATQEASKRLREHGDKEKREIKKKLDETIKQLQVKATELMKQIDDDVDRAQRMIAECQSVLDQTRGAMEYMKIVIEKGNQTDVIHVECMWYDDDDGGGGGDDDDDPEYDDYIGDIRKSGKIFEFNEELRKHVNSGLGTLKKLEQTDHKMSSAEVDGEMKATKKSKLVILAKSKTGKFTYNPIDNINVQISPEENVVVKENYAGTDGTIEVEFTPKVAGQLRAEVQVNGHHVSNSPLVMNVQPQQMVITREFKIQGIKSKSSDFTGIVVNKDNSKIAVANQSANCVHVFNTNGDLLWRHTSLSCPQGISFLNNTDLVIADSNNHRLCIVNATTGVLVKAFGSKGNGNGQFSYPQGIHVDDDANIWVCDLSNNRVQVFTKNGEFQYQFSLTPKYSFSPVNVVTRGDLIYVNDFHNVIHVFERKTSVVSRTSTIGSYGSADGQLKQPCGLAIDDDHIDDDHHLLVCDRGNNRIQKFTLDGRLVGKTCDHTCTEPKYLAVLRNGQVLVTTKKGILIYADQ